MEVIIGSIISGACAIIVCSINNSRNNDRIQAVLEVKLEELTRRVDLHNNVIERMYGLESRMTRTETGIENIREAQHERNN